MCDGDFCLPWIFSRRNQRNRLEGANHTFSGIEASASACLSKSACRYSITRAGGRAKLCQCANVCYQLGKWWLIFLTDTMNSSNSSPQPYPVHVTVQHPIHVPIYKVHFDIQLSSAFTVDWYSNLSFIVQFFHQVVTQIVEKKVPYTVEKPYKVEVERPFPVEVFKKVEIPVPHHYPVHVPVYKHVIQHSHHH